MPALIALRSVSIRQSTARRGNNVVNENMRRIHHRLHQAAYDRLLGYVMSSQYSGRKHTARAQRDHAVDASDRPSTRHVPTVHGLHLWGKIDS